MNHPKGEESTSLGERCSSRTTCPQQLCSAAEPSPDKCGTAAGADISRRAGTYAAGPGPVFFGRPAVAQRGVRREGRADAGDCFAIAGRIGSPPAKTASLVLASG